MQPGGRTPAPGELALVQAFANSIDLLTEQDVFTGPEMLRAWLVTRHLLEKEEAISQEDFGRALTFREALRSLVRANNGTACEANALEVLNQCAQRAHLSLHFADDGHSHLQADASGLNGVIGRLLIIVFTAVNQGTWARLKACSNQACQWVYYDTSKNRSGAWCTMAMCGNRFKTHTYRQRRKDQQGEGTQDASVPPRRHHPQRKSFHRQQASR